MNLNLHHEVQQLAPLAPPCFGSRMQWLVYLVSAAQAQWGGERGPLVMRAGKPVEFDHSWSFCVDCDPAWRAKERVVERGACRPDWLQQFIKTKETATC